MKHCKVFLATLILLVMVTGTAFSERYGVYIVDADGGLNVRLGPDIEYRSSLTLSDKSEVVVTDIHNGWGLVTTRNLIDKREPFGWVCMDYLVKCYEIEVNAE